MLKWTLKTQYKALQINKFLILIYNNYEKIQHNSCDHPFYAFRV